MKVVQILITSLSAIVSSCSPNNQQANQTTAGKIEGWRNIPWGSGPEEIRSLYSGKLGPLERDQYERGGTFYRLAGEHRAAARIYKIRFFLSDRQRLKSIMLTPKDETSGCDGLKNDLNDIYGPPRREDLDTYVNIYTADWNDERQGVRVNFMLDDRSDTRLSDFCTVEFQPLPTAGSTGL